MQVARSLQNPEVSCMELPSDSQATPKSVGTRWDIVRTLSGHPDVRIWLTSQRFLRSEGWDMVGHSGTFQPDGTSRGVQGEFRGS